MYHGMFIFWFNWFQTCWFENSSSCLNYSLDKCALGLTCFTIHGLRLCDFTWTLNNTKQRSIYRYTAIEWFLTVYCVIAHCTDVDKNTCCTFSCETELHHQQINSVILSEDEFQLWTDLSGNKAKHLGYDTSIHAHTHCILAATLILLILKCYIFCPVVNAHGLSCYACSCLWAEIQMLFIASLLDNCIFGFSQDRWKHFPCWIFFQRKCWKVC